MPLPIGELVREARKHKQMSQKDLAGRLKNKDGDPISPQYLNDIELDRRVPPEYLLSQIAQKLQLDTDVLHALAGQMPATAKRHSPAKVAEAMKAFRQKLGER
jgi:transcriptional regulator with XRE-family HTH domain